MQVAEIELYELLKGKLGVKEAKSLIEYVETKVDKKLDQKKDVLSLKIFYGRRCAGRARLDFSDQARP